MCTLFTGSIIWARYVGTNEVIGVFGMLVAYSLAPIFLVVISTLAIACIFAAVKKRKQLLLFLLAWYLLFLGNVIGLFSGVKVSYIAGAFLANSVSMILCISMIKRKGWRGIGDR